MRTRSFPAPRFTECISLLTSLACPSSCTRTWGGKYFEKISANLTAFSSSFRCSAASLPTFPMPGKPSMHVGSTSFGWSRYRITMLSMVSHLSNSWARLSLRLYAPYRSSGEYRGGIGFPVAWLHPGQTSFRVYRPQAPHFFRTDRIASILPMELRLAALRGQRLDDAIRRLLDLLFRGLVVRRPHDDPVSRRTDVLHLDRDAVVLLDGLRERLADVHGAVGTEVHRLDVTVDRDVRRDDVFSGDLDERLHPGSLEALVLEGVLVHHALLERAVQRAEGGEEGVPEFLPARFHGLAEARRDHAQEVFRLLLVLPFLDLLAALVLVDRLQREVDVALLRVDLQDLADDLLALAGVVSDVPDPARAALGDVHEAFLVLVLVQGDEGPEVLHVRHGADDEFSLVRPLVRLPGRLRLGHYSRTPRISPRTAAFPPVGFATVAPQTWHNTVLAARSKTICSLPQSSHLTRRNRLAGFGITCAPPRARTSSRGCRAAGGPCGIPGSGSGDGSSSSASRAPRASGGGSRRTPPSRPGTSAAPPGARTAGRSSPARLRALGARCRTANNRGYAGAASWRGDRASIQRRTAI